MTIPENVPLLLFISGDPLEGFLVSESLEGAGIALRGTNQAGTQYCLHHMTPFPSLIVLDIGWLFLDLRQFLLELRQAAIDVPIVIYTDFDIDLSEMEGIDNVTLLFKKADLLRETVLNLFRQ